MPRRFKNWDEARLRSLALIDSEQGLAAEKELARRSKPLSEKVIRRKILAYTEKLKNLRQEVDEIEAILKSLNDQI
jgi:hypothetical protein